MGRILQTHKGGIIEIEDAPFASGGEGAIYNIVSNRTSVAKLILDKSRAAYYNQKMLYMVNCPPYSPANSQITKDTLIWPESILYDKGKFCGFTMPRLGDSIELKNLTLISSGILNSTKWEKYRLDRAEGFGNWLKICYNLAQALKHLHYNGNYVMVDLKPENIMLKNNGQFSLIDMNNIQISSEKKLLFNAQVGTDDYAAPEIANLNFKKDYIPPEWDYFCYAIIIYELLLGIQPFNATPKAGESDLGKNIRNGLYVHGKRRKYLENINPQHNYFNKLPKKLKESFNKTLDDGCFDISKRTTFRGMDRGNSSTYKKKIPFTIYC